MIKKRTRYILLFFALFIIIAGIVFYELIMPQIVADRYVRNLQRSAQAVRLTFEELASAAETPILNSLDAPAEKKAAGISRLKTAVSNSRTKLTALEQTSTQLHPLPYTGYTGSYAKARVLQKRTQHVLAQTDDAFDSLNETVEFLESYNRIIDTSTASINDFNAVSDLTTLLGKGEDIRTQASRLRAGANDLKNLPVPSGLRALVTPSYENIVQAAKGFDDLATGLDRQDDRLIDDAAHTIEEAGRQLDSHHQTLYVSTVQGSRTIKNIYELNEKLDVILP